MSTFLFRTQVASSSYVGGTSPPCDDKPPLEAICLTMRPCWCSLGSASAGVTLLVGGALLLRGEVGTASSSWKDWCKANGVKESFPRKVLAAAEGQLLDIGGGVIGTGGFVNSSMPQRIFFRWSLCSTPKVPRKSSSVNLQRKFPSTAPSRNESAYRSKLCVDSHLDTSSMLHLRTWLSVVCGFSVVPIDAAPVSLDLIPASAAAAITVSWTATFFIARTMFSELK
mmetsp:Transcript_30371/g.88797  ORF Transcript_30371/g.88797 Transcript_30371/m.88797 type:complete len:226 (+) Transcript_30371:549-1226(+)